MPPALELWIREIRRYNPRLHLVGPGMLADFERHVQACLPLLEAIPEPELADIGSGSGLPAIPYLLLHPAARVTLIERSGKKCLFLRHVADLLELPLVNVCEADPLTGTLAPFPAVMSRAFSPKHTLDAVVRRILEPGGRFYALGTETPSLGSDFRAIGVPIENAGVGLYRYTFTPR